VGAQLSTYSALVNAIAFAGFWVEFWGEVISSLVPNSGIVTAKWNTGSFITKLGILVVDSNNNVQLAYNAPGYGNTGVNSMSIQAGVLQQASNSYIMDYLVNAVISSPKSFTYWFDYNIRLLQCYTIQWFNDSYRYSRVFGYGYSTKWVNIA